ncbi:Non-structural protein NS1 [Portunus trituberculatus]|uniref:Non-structural protein NS1 n=1 Tax=Portunus trituberculatus TaxID=210409 RepID=A0A5B7GN16_PORTR|nr:Non-structural protein NS1 [Portunus trituberculatus]
MFQANEIDITEFFAWFTVIADKKLNKVNTFILQGPTGTGKTLTLSTLLKCLNTGTITRGNDNNQFHLQNLLSRNYALFEEPRIGVATVDEYKLLLEGSNFEINVKNSDMETLHRIPIFITTNRDIDYWVSPVDGQALQSRCKTFRFKQEIKGLSDRAQTQYGIDPPPQHISAADFLAIYQENRDDINKHVEAFEYTSAPCGQHAHHSLPLFKTITASAAAHIPSLNLPPKRPAMSPSVAKKTRKSLTLEVKLDIIHKHKARKLIALLATILTPSTVSIIFKSADSIKKAGETVSPLQAKRTT